MPVILLSDQSMGYRTRTISTPDLSASSWTIAPHPRPRCWRSTTASRIPTPGCHRWRAPDENGMYVATGLEHDEAGEATTPREPQQDGGQALPQLRRSRANSSHGNGVNDSGGGAEIGIIGWAPPRADHRGAQEGSRGGRARRAPAPQGAAPPAGAQDRGVPLALKKVIVIEENHTHSSRGTCDPLCA